MPVQLPEMQEETRSARWRAALGWSVALAAALAAFFYFWLGARVGTMYYAPTGLFPVFLTGGPFFVEHAAYAGGMAEYAAAFLYQLFYYPWVGALIVVLAAAAATAGAWTLARAIAPRPPLWLAALPGLFVMMLADRYVHLLAGVIALVLASCGAALWLRMRAWRAPWRGVMLVGLCAPLYYVAGGAAVCFAFLCALGEALQGRVRWALAAAAVGAVVPFVWAYWLLPVRLSDAYLRLLPLHRLTDPQTPGLAIGLFLSVPLVAIGSVLLTRQASARAGAGVQQTSLGSRRWLRGAGAVAFAAAAVAAVLLSHNRRLGLLLRMEKAKRTGAWEEVVSLGRTLPRGWVSPVSSWGINLALERSGQLLDHMFEFPQSPVRLLPTPNAFEVADTRHVASMEFSDVMLTLGLANHAERAAFPAIELFGRRSWVLRRLAVTTAARGETQVTAMLLKYLEGDLIYGRWARRQRAMLLADPKAWGGEQVRLLKARLPKEDHPQLPAYDEVLTEQFASDPQNRPAFDYLVATDLVQGDLESVARLAARLPEAGYDRLPRHVDEALALCESRRPGLSTVLRPTGAARKTLKAFAAEFAEIVATGGDPRPALRRHYGGTYFYYYAFGPEEEARL